MHQIDFRGQILKAAGMLPAGSWVTGGYYMDDCYGGCPEGKHYILAWNSGGPGGFMEQLQVDPKTLGQYSVIKDKAGEKLYAGDIVQLDDTDEVSMWVRGEKALVEFVPGRFRIRTESGEVNMMQEDMSDIIKKIGNIIDNPDLIVFKR